MRSLTVAALLLAGVAAAAPLKLAVVYGHNGGTATRPALRFAENDAVRVAATLVELAGVKPSDLKLLKGGTKEDFEAAMNWAAARVAASKTQTLLYVYLSAHGDDGRGLELGPQTLAWADLKAKLSATKADVRVAFIDACNASGMLEAGGRASDAFEIRADDRLTVAGEAVITSSAENEPSLEAGAYRGSVFTHHLIAALRGAADRSTDSRISLEELYRYAYARTVEGDSGQHPGYGFKLAGHGELFVSSIKGAPAIVLPRGTDAVGISAGGELFLEVRQPDARTIALPPGKWDLEIWRNGKARVGAVTLKAGQTLAVDDAGFMPATAKLVRLSASPHYCVTAISSEPALKERAARLLAEITTQEAHACFEGATTATLTLTRSVLTGSLGNKRIEVRADEKDLATAAGKALAEAL